VTLKEAADRAIAKGQALFAQAMTQFRDGDIGRCLEQSHDRRSMSINPMRLAISALNSWLGIVLLPRAHSPINCAIPRASDPSSPSSPITLPSHAAFPAEPLQIVLVSATMALLPGRRFTAKPSAPRPTFDLAADVADDQPTAQDAQLPLMPPGLFGMSVAARHHCGGLVDTRIA
jgi:hypothetical protein